MVVRNPLILVSGCFSQLPYGDTVPGTDTVAQASGNAALVLGNTALASGNSALVVGSVAQASGNAALVVGTTALASGNAALVVGSNALASGAIAQASGNAALSAAGTALSSGNAALSLASTALASGNSALILGVGALPASGGVLSGDVTNTASGYFGIPAGTTTERPSVPASGVVRYNATTSEFEGYTTDWSSFLTKSSTGDITVNSINSGPLAGFRNAIINGNFDLWQRGTSFSTASNPYYADRWTSNGSTKQVDRRSFTLGQTEVPGNPTYYLEFALTDTSSSGPNLNQPIEYVSTFAGQEVTLSFWCRAVGSGFDLTVDYQQNFGTGGSPSSSVSADFGTPTLTTSWARYTYTLTLPSISGKTLGSDSNDHLKIRFKPPANTICEFQIAQVQLELGPVATSFERRPIGTEYALCQRYYHKTRQNLFSSGNANIARIHVFYPTSMRATPTITFTTATGGALDWACPEFAQFYKGGAGVSIELTSATFDAEL